MTHPPPTADRPLGRPPAAITASLKPPARHRRPGRPERLTGNPGQTRQKAPPPLLADLDCAVHGSVHDFASFRGPLPQSFQPTTTARTTGQRPAGKEPSSHPIQAARSTRALPGLGRPAAARVRRGREADTHRLDADLIIGPGPDSRLPATRFLVSASGRTCTLACPGAVSRPLPPAGESPPTGKPYMAHPPSSGPWSAAGRTAASTPDQVAGDGPAGAGLIRSQLISPCRSTARKTWAGPAPPVETSATTVLSSLMRIDSSLKLATARSTWLSTAGLTWARNAASKWARTCAPDRGTRGIAAISHRSWTPAVVSGRTTAVAGAAAAAGPPGADAAGEPHPPDSSTIAALSAARTGPAGRPGLLSLGSSFMVSPFLGAGHEVTATTLPGAIRALYKGFAARGCPGQGPDDPFFLRRSRSAAGPRVRLVLLARWPVRSPHVPCTGDPQDRAVGQWSPGREPMPGRSTEPPWPPCGRAGPGRGRGGSRLPAEAGAGNGGAGARPG
jgi:hypothetical protein